VAEFKILPFEGYQNECQTFVSDYIGKLGLLGKWTFCEDFRAFT